MPTVEIFVDESRHGDYVLVAAVVTAGDLGRAKKVMRSLKPANRDRVHMHDEGRSSRAKIIAEFIRQRPVSSALVFTAPIRGRAERQVRTELLRALTRKAVELGANRILIESCAQDKQDRAAVLEVLVPLRAHDRVAVVVDAPRSNEMLWAADIIAWCYTHRDPKLAAANLVEVIPLE
ncbi:hypothetical protein [Rhodococcoides fascians]|uniref:hypothetical protein n=1 Tax=Rhodococcoides fascians TaxID=1828 RepID=UPI00055D9A4B|nr:hypothetical protein [Rhodococcus fascians]